MVFRRVRVSTTATPRAIPFAPIGPLWFAGDEHDIRRVGVGAQPELAAVVRSYEEVVIATDWRNEEAAEAVAVVVPLVGRVSFQEGLVLDQVRRVRIVGRAEQR